MPDKPYFRRVTVTTEERAREIEFDLPRVYRFQASVDVSVEALIRTERAVFTRIAEQSADQMRAEMIESMLKAWDEENAEAPDA